MDNPKFDAILVTYNKTFGYKDYFRILITIDKKTACPLIKIDGSTSVDECKDIMKEYQLDYDKNGVRAYCESGFSVRNFIQQIPKENRKFFS